MNPWTPLAVASLGWAFSTVLSRFLIQRGLDTFTILPFRFGFALLTLLMVVGVTGRFRGSTREAWGLGAILGVVAMGAPNIVMTLALQDLPVSLGGLFAAMFPISTMIAAHFVVPGERFHAASVPGMALALAGSAFLVGVGADTIEGIDNLWRGVVWSMVGVAIVGLGTALTRRYSLKVGSNQLILPQFTVSTLLVLLTIPLVGRFDMGQVDGGDMGWMAALGVVGTTLPFVAFLVAASVNPAWRLGLTGYIVPILAVGMAVLLLGESLTLPLILGAAMIIVGVRLADRAASRAKTTGTLRPS